MAIQCKFRETVACKLFAVGFLLVSVLAAGQNGSVKKIVLQSNNPRLDSLIKILSTQANLHFSYNPKKVQNSLKINVLRGTYPVSTVLSKIQQQTGFQVTIFENHVVLNPPKQKPPSTIPVATHKPTEIPVKSTLPQVENPPSDSIASKLIVTNPVEPEAETPSDSIVRISDPEIGNSFTAIEFQRKDSITQDREIQTRPESTKNNPEILKPNSKKGLNTFASMGINADETLYAGATFKAGLPWLFASASWKTNFSVSLLSVGGGTSVQLKNKSRMGVTFSTGTGIKKTKASTVILVDTAKVPINVNVEVRSRLTRYGLFYEKQLSPNYSIGLTLHFNQWSGKFFVDNQPSAIGLLGKNADATFSGFQPPRTLTNSFTAESTSSKRSWLGLEICFTHKLKFLSQSRKGK